MRKFEIVKEYKDKDIKLPKRATKLSAGYDLAAAKRIILPAFDGELPAIYCSNFSPPLNLKDCFNFNKDTEKRAVKVPTGIKIYCNSDEYISFAMRSSVAGKGNIIMTNAPATIDADYVDNEDNEGHCLIQLKNLNPFPVIIEKGDKIAQAIFLKYLTVDDEEEVGTLRAGGIGSTTECPITEYRK